MKGPWLRWLLLTVFVVALAVTFVNLGRWQLDRLDQRRDRNETVLEHESAPVVAFEQVFTGEIEEHDQWQRVSVTGIYDAERQVQVRYRSEGGMTGWELVTPLTTADGTTVLIDRGFVERPRNQDFPSALPAPPAGEVTVVGYVRRDEQGPENALTPSPDTNDTVRLINAAAIGSWLGRDVVSGYIGLISSDPPQDGPFLVVEPPPQDEGPHLSYALQWFAFTAIAGIGLVVLIRNDLRDRARVKARAERDTAGDAAGHA